MPHIFHALDYTVALFIVHRSKLALVHHRKLKAWLPVGGHIELGEDPETAALREAREETGLEIELIGERPPTSGGGTRALITPRFLDVHRISETHEHVGIIYFARPKGQETSLRLHGSEHHALGWFGLEELSSLEPPLSAAVRWYCEQALSEVRT